MIPHMAGPLLFGGRHGEPSGSSVEVVRPFRWE